MYCNQYVRIKSERWYIYVNWHDSKLHFVQFAFTINYSLHSLNKVANVLLYCVFIRCPRKSKKSIKRHHTRKNRRRKICQAYETARESHITLWIQSAGLYTHCFSTSFDSPPRKHPRRLRASPMTNENRKKNRCEEVNHPRRGWSMRMLFMCDWFWQVKEAPREAMRIAFFLPTPCCALPAATRRWARNWQDST